MIASLLDWYQVRALTSTLINFFFDSQPVKNFMFLKKLGSSRKRDCIILNTLRKKVSSEASTNLKRRCVDHTSPTSCLTLLHNLRCTSTCVSHCTIIQDVLSKGSSPIMNRKNKKMKRRCDDLWRPPRLVPLDLLRWPPVLTPPDPLCQPPTPCTRRRRAFSSLHARHISDKEPIFIVVVIKINIAHEAKKKQT
jgi:hypothetical protein